MSIKPFVDAPFADVGTPVQDPWRIAKEAAIETGQLAASGAMDTAEVDRFRQGINTRGPADFVVSMLPWMSDRGFPKKTGQRFDPTIEKHIYGQPKLFEDLGNAGPFNGKFAPFDDIADLDDPVAFIQDPGSQRYPVVLLSPNWTDPATMDGVIEPLAIRESLTNASIGGPWVAHDIRASIQPTIGPEILGNNLEISTFMEFEPRTTIRPYFDAQDLSMGEKPRPTHPPKLEWSGISGARLEISSTKLIAKFTVTFVDDAVPVAAEEIAPGQLEITGGFAGATALASDFEVVIDALDNWNATVITDDTYSNADISPLTGIASLSVSVDFAAEGYAFPVPSTISPFNDIDSDDYNTTDIDFNQFEISGSFMSTGKFIDDPRFGILGKSAVVGFVQRGGNYVVDDSKSGNRRVNGVDSIAFGGLLK